MAEFVSKNFTKEELSCKCCGVYGMKPIFIEKLQELREHFSRPMIITSAFRCPKHNTAIRGESDSQHLLGLAVDVAIVDSFERFELISYAVFLGFRGIGVDGCFVHLDYRASPPKLWLYPTSNT